MKSLLHVGFRPIQPAPPAFMNKNEIMPFTQPAPVRSLVREIPVRVSKRKNDSDNVEPQRPPQVP